MSEDYGFPGKRKTKNDKRAKVRYNKYKRGEQKGESVCEAISWENFSIENSDNCVMFCSDVKMPLLDFAS